MTKSKDQRRHQKRQKESQRDYKRATTPSGFATHHVTRKNLTVRVSVAAYERLKELPEYEGITKVDMLNHLLISQIPRYSSTADDKHHWDDQLMDNSGLSAKRRAAKESKKLSY